MNRFAHDSTTEIVVPLPHRRGVHLVIPLDLAEWEWGVVDSLIRARIDEQRVAEGLPVENRTPRFASAGR